MISLLSSACKSISIDIYRYMSIQIDSHRYFHARVNPPILHVAWTSIYIYRSCHVALNRILVVSVPDLSLSRFALVVVFMCGCYGCLSFVCSSSAQRVLSIARISSPKLLILSWRSCIGMLPNHPCCRASTLPHPWAYAMFSHCRSCCASIKFSLCAQFERM